MKILSSNINPINYKSNKSNKREFIDILTDNVKNPRDIQDCVAVPRGIFKAYLYLMGGSSLMTLAGILPLRFKNFKLSLNIVGICLNFMSAIYFAKPFAIKGLNPTINKNEFNK